MNGFITGVCLALLPTVAASAPTQFKSGIRSTPCRPSPEEAQLIREAAEKAIRAKEDLGPLIKREASLRAAAENGALENLQAWARADADLTTARESVAKLVSATVALTQRLYGVGPHMRGDTAKKGLFDGLPATWNPRAWDEAAEVYRVQRPDGTFVYMRGPSPGAPSTTNDNGDAFVSWSIIRSVAGTGDPSDLALALHHEGAHFDQLVSTGWGSHRQAQIQAYSAEILAAQAIGVDQTVVDDLRMTRRDYMLGREGSNSSAYITIERSDKDAIVWQGELSATRERLLTRLHDESEARRRADDYRDAPNDQAERGGASEAAERERQRLEDGRRLWASLADFARRFCQAAVDGRVPESMYPEWLEWRNGNYLAFSRELPMVDMTILPGPVECADFFVNQILVARRSGYNHSVLTFEWAAEVVREAYRRSHPSVPTLPTPPTAPPLPPQAEPPSYPDPSADVPNPARPEVPWCLQAPGRRCIR